MVLQGRLVGGGWSSNIVVPLTVRGVELRRPDDSIFKYRGGTGFRAPDLYHRGERGWLEEFYGRMGEVGVNTIRTFGMWGNTNYAPDGTAKFYDDLIESWEHAKQHGFYTHYVALCDQADDTSPVWMPVSKRDQHVSTTIKLARDFGFLFYEIENETWKNGYDALASRYPSSLFQGLLAMRSSWPEEKPPVDPSLGGWLSLATKHTDRGLEWTRKAKVLHEMQFEGLGMFDAAGIPSISGEPERIGGNTTPRQHADNAAVQELCGAGGCLHGGFSTFDSRHDSDLQNCKFTGSANAMACIQAVADVWHSDILDPRLGAVKDLTRGTEYNDGDCPVVHWDRYNFDSPANHPEDGLCRTYFKMLGGLFYGLSVDPASKWPGYKMREGWKIVEQGGYSGDGHGGNLLKLSR